MQKTIDQLVKNFESGQLTRRQLVAQVTGLVTAAVGLGQTTVEAASTFKAVGLNHIALSVTDVPKSRDFYVNHLGVAVSRESSSNCFLTFGNDFLALFHGNQPGMHHYCYSIEDYNVTSAAEKLREKGIRPEIQDERIYFPDPDGLIVQLAATDHKP